MVNLGKAQEALEASQKQLAKAREVFEKAQAKLVACEEGYTQARLNLNREFKALSEMTAMVPFGL